MHTKDKWKLRRVESDEQDLRPGDFVILGGYDSGNLKWVATAGKESNAKRICQMNNSFDELLEVSKMIVAENLANYEALGELAFAIDYIANKAKQAIAEAETKC